MEQSNKSIHDLQKEQNHLGKELQEHVSTLTASFKSEQGLSLQLIEAKEAGFRLKEQLCVSNDSLAEARNAIMSLQIAEEAQSQEVANMRAELLTLRAQPVADPHSVTRLKEIESHYSQLQREFLRLQRDLEARNEQVQRQQEEAFEKQSRLAALEIQLDEAAAQSAKLEDWKSKYEVEANKRYESLKSQLLKSSEAERNLMAKNNAAAMGVVQRQKATAEERSQELEQYIKTINSEKENEFRELKDYITALHTAKDNEVGSLIHESVAETQHSLTE